MKKYITYFLIALITFFTTEINAGEAHIQKTFKLNVPFKNLKNYIEKNKNNFADTLGLKVIKKQGNQTRVKKYTRKGTFDFAVEESIKSTDFSITYQSKLVKSYKGNMEDMNTKITAENTGNHTKVHVDIFIKINDNKVRDSDVRIDINRTIKKVQVKLENEV